jgi:hypothetical protein
LFKKIANEILRSEEVILGLSFLGNLGFDCLSTVNISDKMVNQYLELHRNPSDNNNGDFIIEDYQPGRLLVCKTKSMDFQFLLVYFLKITENQFIVKFQIKFGRMKFSSEVCISNKNKMKLTICMMCCMMPESSAEITIV